MPMAADAQSLRELGYMPSPYHDLGEVTIIGLEDLAGAVVELHDTMGDETRGAVDLATLTPLLQDTAFGVKMLRDFGFTGTYYIKEAQGKKYVIFKGNAQFRNYIRGTRYLATNPTVAMLGLSGEVVKGVARKNMLLTLVVYVPLEVARYIMKDDVTVGQLISNASIGVAAAVISTAIGIGAVAVVGTVGRLRKPRDRGALA